MPTREHFHEQAHLSASPGRAVVERNPTLEGVTHLVSPGTPPVLYSCIVLAVHMTTIDKLRVNSDAGSKHVRTLRNTTLLPSPHPSPAAAQSMLGCICMFRMLVCCPLQALARPLESRVFISVRIVLSHTCYTQQCCNLKPARQARSGSAKTFRTCTQPR